MIKYKLIGYGNPNNGFKPCLCCLLVFTLFIASFAVIFAVYSSHFIFSSSVSEEEISTAFEDFMITYNKYYDTEDEQRIRQQIFAANYIKIKEFNEEKPDRPFTLGINQFADLTDEEFKLRYLTDHTTPSNIKFEKHVSKKQAYIEEDIDWVAKGLVSPIKDQGNCGSCWTFGSISTIESRYAKIEGKLRVFSEQQLVDCCRTENSIGCSGGEVEDALPYVKKTGIAELAEYPYVARDEECKEKRMKNLYKAVDGFSTVPPMSPLEMQRVLSNHTMYVSVNAGAFVFRFYKKGIITEGCPGHTLGHGVTLVGSGKDEKGIKFWKIRNSWGKNWGDKGYVYFLRDLEDKGYGMCGVARHVVYPLYREN